jgi:2-polyprenyl-3-methyl-5-hydroxy-6-metoxy-1,4-benzoquinol methylase
MTLRPNETQKCPACCSARPIEPLYLLKSCSVYRCACGVKYLDPSLDMENQMELYKSSLTLKEINPVLESYYEYAAIDPRSATFRDYKKALEAVEGQVSGRSLLDVGCGTGFFLDYAIQRKWKVCGIDSSNENISKLLPRGINGIAGNFLIYPFQEKFDVIVLWDVIEHLQSPRQFISRAKSLLNPGGVILIATPNDKSIIVSLASFLYWITGGRVKAPLQRFYVLEHTSYFSPQTLRPFLEQEIQVIDYWQADTDLDRYRLPFYLKAVLRCLIAVGIIFNQRTRFLMIARRVDAS